MINELELIMGDAASEDKRLSNHSPRYLARQHTKQCRMINSVLP